MTDRDLIAEARAAWHDTGENFEIWAVRNFADLLDEFEQTRTAHAKLQADTQEAFVRIAAKQQRDAQLIADLQAQLREAA